MKAVILKPIMWNSINYTGPSGYPSTSGFAHEFGYGHEEWNNNTRRVWRNYKVFHTESTDKLLQYSNTGELTIVTVASYNRAQYAISIATNVFDNNEDERTVIARELNVYNDWNEVWSIDRVKNCFNNNQERFLTHWESNYRWIRWKCPITQYHHFSRPILLNPSSISGKSRLTSMHGRFQFIYPEQCLQIIGNNLPGNHLICEWLSSSDFDDEVISKAIKNYRSTHQIRPPRRRSDSNAPAISAYQYWVEGNRNVEPHHALLQAKFVNHLTSNNLSYQENVNYIDVKYQLNGIDVFVEIKPTDKIQTKYAIRIAIGQILEYRYRINNQAILEIVLGSRPSNEEISFVNSLGILLTYFDLNSGNFIRANTIT